MNLESGNLFGSDEWPVAESEHHRDLAAWPNVRIEQIESNAYASAEGEWFDQDEDEWVAVITGDAVIEFADGTWHAMCAGDWVVIPAHVRHRIAGTSDRTV